MSTPTGTVRLRDLRPDDLPILFEQQLDPQANWMAAFTSKDPTDRAAFDAHWARVAADPGVFIQAIEYDGALAGSVLKYMDGDLPEVSYWIGREFWGKGVATRALAAFLQVFTQRPVQAHVAHDNLGSIRVLEKCGFIHTGVGQWFANARGQEIEEAILMLY